MFRLNYWPPRPFLAQAAPSQGFPRFPFGMENSSFLQNPLSSPALMVLASTAEAAARDGARLPPPACFPGQDKDLANIPYSTNSFMYRQGEPFSPSLVSQLGAPFVHPSLGLINSAAFRPMTSAENSEGYQSAFTPTKRTKVDDSSINTEDRNSVEKISWLKEEKVTSPNPSIEQSDNQSEGGDLTDRSTPDDAGRNLRKRKRTLLDGQIACPVCGLTVRQGELESHLKVEFDKLERLTRGGRKSTSRENTPQGRGKVQPSPATSRKSCSSPSQTETTVQSRYESYLRIKGNRNSRLAARNRNRRRKGTDETSCPVCNDRLTGSPEELNSHVEQCLKKRGDNSFDGDLDVDGDYEEYTWAGQTRIRATTMLDGGLKASGFATGSKSAEDEDIDLNVDGDDSEQYGKPQYSEADIVPCTSDEEDAKERELLRGAVISMEPSQTRVEPIECSKWGEGQKSEANSSEAVSSTDTTQHGNKDVSSSTSEIIESLRSKLREQEEEKQKASKFKCLICMETYAVPLVSIQCWHVHCEECWLRTLGAKKLCPQCNMITSPGDLRKLYL